MQDQPTPSEILGAVIAYLKGYAGRAPDPLTTFQMRVAANALEIAKRELDLAPAAQGAERERLARILGADGDLETLNAAFAAALSEGRLDLKTPEVADHLWRTTLDKLAVDQPAYSGYRAALAERGEAEQKGRSQ